MSALRDVVAARPGIDWALPAGGAAAWVTYGAQHVTIPVTMRVEIYVGASTLAGLVLAAATFVCALTYQSENPLITDVRKRFARPLKRNWVAIMASTLVAALLPLVSLAVDSTSPRLATTLTLVALLTVCVRFARSLYWLSFTLFLQSATDRQPPRVVVQLPERRAG